MLQDPENGNHSIDHWSMVRSDYGVQT